MSASETINAHGRTWPTYQPPVYHVEVHGVVDRSRVDREELESQLRAVLEPHGLTAKVIPMMSVEMSPEDRAERNRLDDLVMQGLGHMA